MNRFGTAAALLGLAASIPAARVRAEVPVSPQTGATLSSSTLPEGHVSLLPVDAPPKSVPVSEQSEGLVGVSMSRKRLGSRRGAGEPYGVMYLSSQKRSATRLAEGQGDDTLADTCLVDGGNVERLNDVQKALPNGEPRDWPTGYSATLSLMFSVPPAGRRDVPTKGRSRQGSDVHAVHSERFVPGSDGHASLAIVDAWVDARTRGTRVYARSTLPLARVFVGPNGREVYAARDGDKVQVVFRASVQADPDADVSEQIRRRTWSLNATLPDLSGANGDCGHLRVTLRPRPGSGEMTTLPDTAFLPSLDGESHSTSDQETPEERGNRLFQAMRQRPFQLSVSATLLTADEHPIVSIALGWNGREVREGSGG